MACSWLLTTTLALDPLGRPMSSVNTNDKDDPPTAIGPFLFATYDVNNVISTEEQHLLQPQETRQQHLESFIANREKAAAAGVVAEHIMKGFEPKDHFYLYVCKKHVVGGRGSMDCSLLADALEPKRLTRDTAGVPSQVEPHEEETRGMIYVRKISGTVLADGSIPVVMPLEPSLAASLMPVAEGGTFGRKSSMVFTSDAAIAAAMETVGGPDDSVDTGLNASAAGGQGSSGINMIGPPVFSASIAASSSNTTASGSFSEVVVVSHRLSETGGLDD